MIQFENPTLEVEIDFKTLKLFNDIDANLY